VATYVSLVNWTEQGAKAFADSASRGKDAEKAAQALGGRYVQLFWTMGPYDVVAITEFPDDETASAFALKLGAQGNVRTLTMRAYNAEEMGRIVAKTK
jgi:uncharacterized protein with GYD domain